MPARFDITNATGIATGAATAAVGGLTYLQQIQAIVGISVGVIGAVGTLAAMYWGYRKHKRAEDEHRARMSRKQD